MRPIQRTTEGRLWPKYYRTLFVQFNGNMDKLDEFKHKEKFEEDSQIFYLGLADPGLRKILTERINRAADDFNEVSLRPGATADEYREVIKKGLERFEQIYLDTEDRERICHYFEELMHIVGLESSGGILNKFMYGFNPDDFAPSK
jgi:Domain of unknown function (DUF4844)